MTTSVFLSRKRKTGKAIRAVLLTVLVSLPASASVIYTFTGTFDETAPPGPFSSPNATVEITFTVPDNPVVDEFDGTNFALGPGSFSNFSYRVAGTLVGISPANILFSFYSPDDGGSVNICFTACSISSGVLTPPNGIVIGALPAQYTGPASSPTMTSGTFVGSLALAYVDTNPYLVNSPSLEGTPSGTVPEPRSVLLVLSGLFALLPRTGLQHLRSAYSRRRQRARANQPSPERGS